MNSQNVQAMASPRFFAAGLHAATDCTIIAVCCFAFFSHPAWAMADEPNASNGTKGNAQFEPLFNGRDFQGWKQSGNWQIADKAFYCQKVDGNHGSDDNLHFAAKGLPADCELVFEWRESGKSQDSKRQNPGLGINYNVGTRGGGGTSTYGAGIDYHVSGIDIRLHTRSVDDTSAIKHKFNSGFVTDWPVKDFSNRIGEWNRSRILCKGSRIQFWLNGKQAFDLDLEKLKAQSGHDGPAVVAFAIDDWIGLRNGGLCLTIVAPYSNEIGAPRVQIRSMAVRRLNAMERRQPEAKTTLPGSVENPPSPTGGENRKSNAPIPVPVPGPNEEGDGTSTRPR
jgi:hypothetical protein